MLTLPEAPQDTQAPLKCYSAVAPWDLPPPCSSALHRRPVQVPAQVMSARLHSDLHETCRDNWVVSSAAPPPRTANRSELRHARRPGAFPSNRSRSSLSFAASSLTMCIAFSSVRPDASAAVRFRTWTCQARSQGTPSSGVVSTPTGTQPTHARSSVLRTTLPSPPPGSPPAP